MKKQKEPRVIVVTGASAGVGRATVRAFAKEGAQIGLIARVRRVSKARSAMWKNVVEKH